MGSFFGSQRSGSNFLACRSLAALTTSRLQSRGVRHHFTPRRRRRGRSPRLFQGHRQNRTIVLRYFHLHSVSFAFSGSLRRQQSTNNKRRGLRELVQRQLPTHHVYPFGRLPADVASHATEPSFSVRLICHRAGLAGAVPNSIPCHVFLGDGDRILLAIKRVYIRPSIKRGDQPNVEKEFP